jgi:septal ring factor EnvC (AmiA/AmiB activator)
LRTRCICAPPSLRSGRKSRRARAARLVAQQHALRSDLLARRTELAAVSAAERLRARRAAGAADREAERALALGEEARDLATLVRRLGTRTGSALGSATRPGGARRAGAVKGGGPSPYRLPVAGGLVPSENGGGSTLSLLARPNAIVVAPAAGRVAFAGPFRGYGAIVIVEHADGWTSLVTGLATTQVTIGQTLVAGSPLGQAPPGSPRIGLELRRDGQAVNPLDQLR